MRKPEMGWECSSTSSFQFLFLLSLRRLRKTLRRAEEITAAALPPWSRCPWRHDPLLFSTLHHSPSGEKKGGFGSSSDFAVAKGCDLGFSAPETFIVECLQTGIQLYNWLTNPELTSCGTDAHMLFLPYLHITPLPWITLLILHSALVSEQCISCLSTFL